jgi:hypothetical protein
MPDLLEFSCLHHGLLSEGSTNSNDMGIVAVLYPSSPLFRQAIAYSYVLVVAQKLKRRSR